MALETTDLFVIQRISVNGSPLLKATATELNDYTNQTLDEVTALGNTTANDISVGNVTLAGGGSNTQALQKQEITSLISAIPAPDFTPYVEKDGDNMLGNLTFNTNKIILNASSGSGTFTGTLEAASIDGGTYAV